MKKINLSKLFLLAVLLVAGGFQSFGQLNGTYTIGGTSPDYTSLSAAINALNSSGINGPVVFNIRDGVYTGTAAQGSIGNVTGASATNTITFKSQSGNKANCVLSPAATSSANNYVFELNGSKYVTIKDLTLNNTSSTYGTDVKIAGAATQNTIENCVLTGNGATSSDATNMSRVFGTSLASTSYITFKGNTFDKGASAAYLWGDNTTSLGSNYVFEDNTFSENYYYWLYCYYMGDITFKGNVFQRTGAATTYFYGMFMYYTGNSLILDGNTFNNSCNATYSYCGYMYYNNYYTQNKDYHPVFKDNVINMDGSTSTTYQYPFYNYYAHYAEYTNNVFNINSVATSGTMYLNTAMYYSFYSRAEGNTYNLNKTGGTIYSGFYYGSNDTFTKNTINVTGGATHYNYMPYYVQNYYVTENNVTSKTTGVIYNYIYYYGGDYARNKIDLETTSTIYAAYMYYLQGARLYNNTFTWKTSGTSYGLYAYYTYAGSKIFNNTFYSNATGATNQLAYIYNGSSSYQAEIKNNIFARSGTNGYAMYMDNSNYVKGDYNIYSVPGGNIFYESSSGYGSTNLDGWRTKTGNDMNSLIYNVPFVNASNKDFQINPASPAAWAVNGRAEHDTNAKVDMAGVVRPYVVTDGVPDLGAYEVTPTSIPPVADAFPSAPVANSTQVFTFGEDTVATIDWGATVPTSYDVRQYTGLQAAPMPVGVGRMYFYVAGTGSSYEHRNTPHVYYKDPWIGDVTSENEAVPARSTNGGAWEGYNYTNASTDKVRNILSPAFVLDSAGSYTGVQEGRIGIRCVESPKLIVLTNVKKDGVDVSWAPVFNPIGYQVIVNTNPAMPADADWNNPSNFVGTNTKTFVNLAEDTKYYVHVRSICGVNDTSGRSVDSFVTLIDCHVPDIKISGLSDTRAIAYWGGIKTAYKYEYVINTTPGVPAAGTHIVQNNVQAPYLDANTQYYVHVKAHCSSIYPESGWGVAAFKTFPLGVSSISTEGNSVEVYPNPAGEQLNVLIGGNLGANGKVMVMDVTGKVLQVSGVEGNTMSVDVAGLASGMYILQYSDDVRVESVRFNKK